MRITKGDLKASLCIFNICFPVSKDDLIEHFGTNPIFSYLNEPIFLKDLAPEIMKDRFDNILELFLDIEALLLKHSKV
jgi:hypothetical protein